MSFYDMGRHFSFLRVEACRESPYAMLAYNRHIDAAILEIITEKPMIDVIDFCSGLKQSSNISEQAPIKSIIKQGFSYFDMTYDPEKSWATEIPPVSLNLLVDRCVARHEISYEVAKEAFLYGYREAAKIEM